MSDTIHIGFLVFPQVTQLDLMGPAQILSRVPGARVHLAWQAVEPVATDVGFTINPTTSFQDCPPLDVVCAPGGVGVLDQLNDARTIGFLRRQGASARYVTSVCNGSLLLGAAGLIDGYDSACHWAWRQFLPRFGARPVARRVVRDRNRLSGGGVTSGIDFALVLAAELAGEETARSIQLATEYDPDPPFDSGSPDKASAERLARYLAQAQGVLEAAEVQVARAVSSARFSRPQT